MPSLDLASCWLSSSPSVAKNAGRLFSFSGSDWPSRTEIKTGWREEIRRNQKVVVGLVRIDAPRVNRTECRSVQRLACPLPGFVPEQGRVCSERSPVH